MWRIHGDFVFDDLHRRWNLAWPRYAERSPSTAPRQWSTIWNPGVGAESACKALFDDCFNQKSKASCNPATIETFRLAVICFIDCPRVLPSCIKYLQTTAAERLCP